MPSWYVAPTERSPELTTVIIKNGIEDLTESPARALLETQALSAYLPKCPWTGHLGEPVDSVKLTRVNSIGEAGELLIFTELEVDVRGSIEHYFLPLGFVQDHLAGTASQQLAVSRLRHKRTAGLLTDAFTLPEFNRKIVSYIRDQVVKPIDGGELRFITLSGAAQYLQNLEQKTADEKNVEEINVVATAEVYGSVVIDEKLVLKPIRKLVPGVHPEIEMNAYLSQLGFSNIAPLLGEVKRVNDKEEFTLMILQGYINNQGDAWQWTQNTLERALRDRLTAGTSSMDMQFPALEELQSFAQMIGRRLGEMHVLLAKPAKNTNFGYLETSSSELTRWVKSIKDRLQQVLDMLRDNPAKEAGALLASAKELSAAIKTLGAKASKGVRIRIHGNFTLAQVLVVRSDAYFVHFEDGLSKGTLDDDLRQSPLKDVADMLCSFDDAGAVAIRSAQAVNSGSQAEQIRAIAATYKGQVHEAFCEAYYAAASESPALGKQSSNEACLKLYRIDNRLREIQKCLHHPDSLEVVIQGLNNILKSLES